jgi:hypothetical protein
MQQRRFFACLDCFFSIIARSFGDLLIYQGFGDKRVIFRAGYLLLQRIVNVLLLSLSYMALPVFQ